METADYCTSKISFITLYHCTTRIEDVKMPANEASDSAFGQHCAL